VPVVFDPVGIIGADHMNGVGLLRQLDGELTLAPTIVVRVEGFARSDRRLKQQGKRYVIPHGAILLIDVQE